MPHIFAGDTDQGVIAIVAIPIAADLCLLGPTRRDTPTIPGIRIHYDHTDESSAAMLKFTKGMEENGILPELYTWEEKGRAEVAILFLFKDPPEALWRSITGVAGLAWSRCIKIYTTCEPDYPLDDWRETLKKFALHRLFILQILKGDTPWVQFNLRTIHHENPSKKHGE